MDRKTRSEGALLTKESNEACDSRPKAATSVLLALSVLIDRLELLPKADRDDLFELLQAWRTASTEEEQRSIRRAVEEILAQTAVSVTPMPLGEDKPLARGLKNWADHVGKKIRALREGAGLTQAQLAGRAGLPQSHISRLENAEHSATNMTLEKIAKALDVSVHEIDPCAD